MNPGMLKRAIQRHRYMRDRPAYSAFLEHIDAVGDVWKAPQAEVARWWKRRQESRLSLSITDRGVLRVESALDGCVVEVNGTELRPAPFECAASAEGAVGAESITYESGERDFFLTQEILGHLGFGHLSHAPAGARPDIPAKELEPILASLRRSIETEYRYAEDAIDSLKRIVAAAHHRHGIPALRIWPLPHRSGRPYRVCVSTRYDVDKAIVNLPKIHELEARHGLKSTVYLRPMGYFYGASEIRRYCVADYGAEVALHGEFATTSQKRFPDEYTAARGEKRLLEEISARDVLGVCMHGGELRSNSTPRTRDAIEEAGFLYETLYRNRYYHPLHITAGDAVRKTLSIGQHFADITVPPGAEFVDKFLQGLVDHFSRAAAVGGVLVPVLHPIYFDFLRYASRSSSVLRLAAFTPRLLWMIARMSRDRAFFDAR